MTRIDAVVVQFVVTDYDETGVPVAERITQPVKVFLPNLPKAIADAQATLATMGTKDGDGVHRD